MLNKLLSIATLLTLSQSTDFNHEVDYNLLYNFGKMGFQATIYGFILNNDEINCDNSKLRLLCNGEYNYNNIDFYNETVNLKLMTYDGGTPYVDQKCQNVLKISDVETESAVAIQEIKYNNKTDTFSVGFFKPTMNNVNITSNAVNDLTIANTFHG